MIYKNDLENDIMKFTSLLIAGTNPEKSNSPVNIYDIGYKLGFSADYSLKIAGYLEKKGIVEFEPGDNSKIQLI